MNQMFLYVTDDLNNDSMSNNDAGFSAESCGGEFLNTLAS